MNKLLLGLLLLLPSGASALDPACTTTSNLGMAYCPEDSTDWYESYDDMINELDALAKTAKSSFTVTTQFLVRGSATVQGNFFSVGSSSFVVTGGKVGVGTTNPATTMSVVGDLQVGSGANKSTMTSAGHLQVAYGITASSASFGGGTAETLTQLKVVGTGGFNTGDGALDADVTNAFGRPPLWVAARGSLVGHMALIDNGAAASYPAFGFFKTRATTPATDANTTVQNNDFLGNIEFFGADGATYTSGNPSAMIEVQAKDPITTDRVPVQLTIRTKTHSGSLASALVIDSTSSVTIAKGLISTATALAAEPSICSAGQAPLGIDSRGNALSCTASGGGDALVAGTQTWKGGNTFAGNGAIVLATTMTMTGPGAQIRIGSSTQNGAAILWGDQSGTIITTNSAGAGMYGMALWAKNLDGAVTNVTTGCFVVINQGVDTTLGHEVPVFKSTTTANASGIYGVTLDLCAPQAYCRIGIAGFFPVMVLASVNMGDYLATSTTRCQGAASTAASRNGVAMKNAPGAGLVPVYWGN